MQHPGERMSDADKCKGVFTSPMDSPLLLGCGEVRSWGKSRTTPRVLTWVTELSEKGDTMEKQLGGNMTISVLVVLSMDFPADCCLHLSGAQKNGLHTQKKVGQEMRGCIPWHEV